MKIFRYILILCILYLSVSLKGQSISNLRFQEMYLSSDTLTLDSLIIVPGSIKISDSTGSIISPEFYTFIAMSGILIFDNTKNISGKIKIEYRVFDYELFAPYNKIGRAHV